MEIKVEVLNTTFKANLDKPIDLSVEVKKGEGSSMAFFAPEVNIDPICAGSFIGNVSKGGAVNTNIVSFNPHGNSTHTESLAHITEEKLPVNHIFKKYIWLAYLCSVNLRGEGLDRFVPVEEIEKIDLPLPEAIILRTSPESYSFSGNNPPYLCEKVTAYLCNNDVKHLLVDLPSVDKEEDGGLLLSHKAFWGVPANLRKDASITELIKIPENIKDGYYLLELQLMNLNNNASPSRPILYELF